MRGKHTRVNWPNPQMQQINKLNLIASDKHSGQICFMNSTKRKILMHEDFCVLFCLSMEKVNQKMRYCSILKNKISLN